MQVDTKRNSNIYKNPIRPTELLGNVETFLVLSKNLAIIKNPMFDFSKIADLGRLAKEAKNIQEKQEKFQRRQIELLEKILEKIEEVIQLLKKNPPS